LNREVVGTLAGLNGGEFRRAWTRQAATPIIGIVLSACAPDVETPGPCDDYPLTVSASLEPWSSSFGQFDYWQAFASGPYDAPFPDGRLLASRDRVRVPGVRVDETSWEFEIPEPGFWYYTTVMHDTPEPPPEFGPVQCSSTPASATTEACEETVELYSTTCEQEG